MVCLDSLFSAIVSFFGLLLNIISEIRFFDIIDILAVAFIIYKCIAFFRDTRAGQLIKGIVILIVIWLLAQWFNLVTIKWLLYKVFDSAIIVAVLLFQPELRRALERMGRSRFGMFNKSNDIDVEKTEACISSICKAAGSMQDQRIGALIVYERNTLLGVIINTGTEIDADVSSALISNIFFPNTPLHDGAMIVRENKIAAAGCILPLVQNDNLNSSLGTRHRAAIGISEISDAIVIVVSEETGIISIAENGKIERDFNTVTLYAELNKRLIPTVDKKKNSSVLSFIKKVLKKEGTKNEK